jgi:hypothetical protein
MMRPDALRVLFTEYNKYLAALVRGVLPYQPTGATVADAAVAERD